MSTFYVDTNLGLVGVFQRYVVDDVVDVEVRRGVRVDDVETLM